MSDTIPVFRDVEPLRDIFNGEQRFAPRSGQLLR